MLLMCHMSVPYVPQAGVGTGSSDNNMSQRYILWSCCTGLLRWRSLRTELVPDCWTQCQQDYHHSSPHFGNLWLNTGIVGWIYELLAASEGKGLVMGWVGGCVSGGGGGGLDRLPEVL